jgi:hypothetical protein
VNCSLSFPVGGRMFTLETEFCVQLCINFDFVIVTRIIWISYILCVNDCILLLRAQFARTLGWCNYHEGSGVTDILEWSRSSQLLSLFVAYSG